MSNIVEIQLKAQALQCYGLPDIRYSVHLSQLERVLSDGGELPFAMLLHGLEQRSRDGEIDSQQDKLAMDRLANLLSSPANT